MKQANFPKEIEQILRKIPESHSEYFRDYFQNAPDELLGAMCLETRKAGRLLTEENEPIEKVYFLLEGEVKAVDFRVKGATYEFAHFGPVTGLGSMECLFDLKSYTTTLVTVTSCTLVSAPRAVFEAWVKNCVPALLKETKNMQLCLLDQARESRVMMMLNGTERLIYLLTKRCDELGRREEYLLSVNRQELAEQSGSSVKTVNRSMKKLEESGLVLRVGHKVKITQKQYAAMQECLDEILNYTSK